MLAKGHTNLITGRQDYPVLVLLCLLAVPALGAEPVVGSVKTIRGDAVVLRGTETMPCREGLQLLLLDTLRTSAGGTVGVILQDGTRIALGPGTELKIDRFVYQPADHKFDLLVHLFRGVIAYVSGKIAQFAPESVRIETPVAVVGLRGTRLAISLQGTEGRP